MITRVSRASRGFTLIEVLIALLIVALGTGAALMALNSAADNTSRMRDRTFAEWIGFNQISTTRLAPTMPTEGVTTGEVEDYASVRWRWQQEVTQISLPGIYRITVKVRHADGASDNDALWLANVTGFRGDAVAAANGEQPNWNGSPPNQGQRAGGTPDSPAPDNKAPGNKSPENDGQQGMGAAKPDAPKPSAGN